MDTRRISRQLRPEFDALAMLCMLMNYQFHEKPVAGRLTQLFKDNRVLYTFWRLWADYQQWRDEYHVGDEQVIESIEILLADWLPERRRDLVTLLASTHSLLEALPEDKLDNMGRYALKHLTALVELFEEALDEVLSARKEQKPIIPASAKWSAKEAIKRPTHRDSAIFILNGLAQEMNVYQSREEKELYRQTLQKQQEERLKTKGRRL